MLIVSIFIYFAGLCVQVQEELDLERRKNESGSADWVVRCQKLTEELEWLRERTDKLTAENKLFIRENRRLQRQLQTQEQDRTFMLQQLVAAKKENARLRLMMEQAGGHFPPQGAIAAAAAGGAKGGAGAGTHPLAPTTSLAAIKQLLHDKHTGAGAAVGGTAGRPLGRASTARAGGASGRPLDEPATSAGRLLKHAQWQDGRGASAGSGAGAGGLSRPTTSASGSAFAAGGDLAMGGEDGTYGDMAVELAQLREELPKLRAELQEATSSTAALRRENKRLEAKARAAAMHQADELSSRNELQDFFRLAVEDVRMDIAERRAQRLRRSGPRTAQGLPSTIAANALPVPPDPRVIPLAEFTAQDRINLVEWLVSQDQVIYTLYEALFPPPAVSVTLGPASRAGGARGSRGGGAGGDVAGGDAGSNDLRGPLSVGMGQLPAQGLAGGAGNRTGSLLSASAAAAAAAGPRLRTAPIMPLSGAGGAGGAAQGGAAASARLAAVAQSRAGLMSATASLPTASLYD